MSKIINKAREVATDAHKGQKRKYTGLPYITHPEQVASMVVNHGGTESMVAAAWLHDVVEDTDITYDYIWNHFGSEIASHVWFLTDISRPEDGNRKQRKKIDREHISLAPPETKTIKLADLINNSESITAYDPNFSIVYMEEKRLLLSHSVLGSGNERMFNFARAIVNKYYQDKDENFSWEK